MGILYIVMPVYNEEEVIEESVNLVTKKLKKLIKSNTIHKNSKVVAVDDGTEILL